MRVLGALMLVVGLAGCGVEQPATPTMIAADQVRLDVQMSPHGLAWAQLGSGPALLLLNGTGSPMSEWDPALLAALAATRRVIVFDYPGLGESTTPAVASFAALADVGVGLVDDLGLAQSDVLGWSMGGFVAQEMLRRDPGRIAKAVLVGTNPGGPQTTLGPEWVQRADSDPAGSDAAYLRTNYPDDACAQAGGQAFLDRLEEAVESGRYPNPKVPTKTYDAMVAAEDPWLRSSMNLRDLADVAKPVLVLVGADDVITPPANSRVLTRSIPGAQFTTVSTSGHSVLFQEPEITARLVDGFLRGDTVPRRVSGDC